MINQRIFTIGGSTAGYDKVAFFHTNNMFSCSVQSDSNWTLLPSMSVCWVSSFSLTVQRTYA